METITLKRDQDIIDCLTYIYKEYGNTKHFKAKWIKEAYKSRGISNHSINTLTSSGVFQIHNSILHREYSLPIFSNEIIEKAIAHAKRLQTVNTRLKTEYRTAPNKAPRNIDNIPTTALIAEVKKRGYKVQKQVITWEEV